MIEPVTTCLLAIAGGYLALGSLFGILFSFAGGARRIDPGAEKGTWGFKLVIIPGCAIFWPYLLLRWVRSSAPPQECSRHRQLAKP